MTGLEEGKTQFKALSDEYLNAVAAKDDQAAETALSKLQDLRGQVRNARFRTNATQFLANARAGQLADAVAARNKITEGLGDLAAAFTNAAAAAEQAEKDLFFKKLSQTLGGIEKTIKAFKARAIKSKEALKSLNKPQDVQELINNVETVKGVLDGLKSDLQSIKDNFPG